jgi:hypothetical protein
MKFTIIDMDVFETILTEISELTEMVQTLHKDHRDKRLEKWLDSQDVCHILNISKRTLRTYRDMGKLPFSKVIGSIYYKPEDVEKLLINSENKKIWK